jgi:type I restriction enzyme S subunit
MSDLPENWSSANVLELSEMIRGVTYSRDDAHDQPENGLIPILRATNITERGLVFDDLVYVPRKLVSSEQVIKAGDVIIAISSGSISVVGKAKQTRSDIDAGFGAFCAVIRLFEGIEPRYFGHFFNSSYYRSTISSLARGVNINNLKRAHFEQIEVPLAPLDEQKRIADKLDTLLARVDKCQTHLARVPQLLKQFRQSVLAVATSGRLTEEWRQLKQDDWEYGSGQLPEGWKWTTTGELCDCIVPNRDKPKSFSGDIPWITLPDFNESIEISASKSSIGLSDDEVKKYRARIIPKGSVVMSCIGRFGITAIATRNIVINQQLHAFLVSEDALNARYLAYAIRTQVPYMESLATATTIAYLNKDNCNSIPIPLPPLAEQDEIVRRVERLFALAGRLEARWQSAQGQVSALTPSLLAKAFRGELVGQ